MRERILVPKGMVPLRGIWTDFVGNYGSGFYYASMRLLVEVFWKSVYRFISYFYHGHFIKLTTKNKLSVFIYYKVYYHRLYKMSIWFLTN